MLKLKASRASGLAVAVILAAASAGSVQAADPAAASAPTVQNPLIGLVLVGNPKDILSMGSVNATGVVFKDIGVPSAEDLKDDLKEYLGKTLNEASRSKIVEEIVLFYRAHGRNVVDVSTPPQEITGGVLQVLVMEGKVGAVRVEGAKYFDSSYVGRQIRAKSGAELDSAELAEDIAWINRNPFRAVDLVYMKGSELGRTDLVLREVDAFPVRVYTGAEDSGTPLTGNYRLLAGLNWGNVFGGDGQMNYQFMTDPKFLYFKAHSVTFIQPLPWRHTLTLLGSYATTHGDVPAPFSLGGYNWQTAMRYEIPLPAVGMNYQHAVQAGYDYKRGNNNLAFGGISVYGTTADTSQFSFGYNSSMKDPWGGTTFRGTLYYSPGEMTPTNTDAALQAGRAGASANYFYGKLEINRTTGLPYDFTLMNMFTGQLSDANLNASEQLGFGGYDSIRGYDNRIVNSDQGFIISNELRAPPVLLLPHLGLKSAQDKLQFLAFIDYGNARDKHALAGSKTTTELLGVGPGLRYTYTTHLSVRADYGWQLINAEADRKNSMRWHLGLVLSY